MRSFFFAAVLVTTFSIRAFAAEEMLPIAPPNWKVELVAKVPELIHPSVVTAAPDGRIFVAQDPIDMGEPSDSAGDSILCIHPDGRITKFAEKLHAVYGLCYVDGKLFVHHTPLFSVFTDKDSVGTDRQDLFTTNPNPNNNGRGFNDHIPSNIRLGMDGWMYMSTGDKGIYGAVGRDGSKGDIQGGGIMRFRPDATKLEPYASGTRNHLDVAINAEEEMFTYDNTDDGNGWWTRVTHMVDGGYYGYPFDYKPQRPYTLWMMGDFGGGSGTGAIAYNEDALPAEYRGNLFVLDWSRKQVVRLKVSREGATYKIDERVQQEKRDFLTQGGTTEFRPVGIAVTPDGMGFYVTDWNHSGWKVNKIAGRLLKMTYTGPSSAAPKPAWWIPAATAKPFQATDAELIAGLSHPAQSVRMVAQRRLADRGAKVVPALKRILADASLPAHARWHAIWALDAIDGGVSARAEILALAASPGDMSVRAQAIRQLGTQRVPDAAATLVKTLRDPEPVVRFRAATALGRIGASDTVPPLLQALDESDFFTRYAVFTALRRIGLGRPDAWPQIAVGFTNRNPAIREGTFFAMRETFSPESPDALAKLVVSPEAPAAARLTALNTLAELHRMAPSWSGRWWGTQPVLREKPAPKSETWAKTAVVHDAILAALRDADESVRRAAIDAVATAQHPSAGPSLRQMWARESSVDLRQALLRSLGAIKDPEASALASSVIEDPALMNDAILVAGQVGDARAIAALTQVADKNSNPPVLVRVLEALGTAKSPDTAPLAGRFLAHADPAVRAAAAAALGSIGGEKAREVVLAQLDAESVATRRAAVEAAGLLKDRAALPRLLALAREPGLEIEAENALAAMPDIRALDFYLNGLNRINREPPYAKPNSGVGIPPPRPGLRFTTAIEALRERALPPIEERHRREPFTGQALAALQRIYTRNDKARAGPLFAGETKPVDAAEYLKFALREPGDAGVGRTLFEGTAGCAACHRVGEMGAQIGPDLTDIAVKYDRTFLIESVLYPSKQILDGYHAVNVTRKNGEVLMGFLRSQTPEELVLVDVSGLKHVVPRGEVAKNEELPVSLMPEGLHASLSLADFSNLVAYLTSLKGKSTP